jgi:hypothetical protein
MFPDRSQQETPHLTPPKDGASPPRRLYVGDHRVAEIAAELGRQEAQE